MIKNKKHIILIWLLIIFIIITVIITVFFGQYKKLGKRDFPDTDINGNLYVTGNEIINGNTTFNGSLNANSNLSVAGNTSFLGNLTVEGLLKSSKLMQSYSTANVAPTAISSSTLTVNTFYKSIAGSATMTIPNGNIGDFITVFYDTAITHGSTHFYGTNDVQFAIGSTCTRIGGAVGSTGHISGSGQSALIIAGNTNGDGGIGTYVKFVNITGTTKSR
jgi:hypothetical protein